MTLVPASSHGATFALPTGFTFPDSDASTKLNNGYETYLTVHDSSTGGDITLDSKYGVSIAPSFTGAAPLAVSSKAGATAPAISVAGGAGATADVARFNGETASVVVNKNGTVQIDQVIVPANAELGAGQLALWFDATNGASKLMVKAKSADGTVVTASIPLT